MELQRVLDEVHRSLQGFKACFDVSLIFYIVTLRGSARGSNLEALPQQGHIFPNAARQCPQPETKCPNPSKFHPKPSPNPTQILPRPSQNRSKGPLGAHVGPMFEKSEILNVQNSNKSGPRASRRGPRPPQTLPKWGPRPSQIKNFRQFLVVFFQFQICIDFWSNVHWFIIIFQRLDIWKIVVFPRWNAIFYKIAIFDKNANNIWKIIPKPFQNQGTTEEKSLKNR